VSSLRLAVLLLLLSSVAAAAAPATTRSNVNLRAAPSIDSAVVVKIPAGARIEVGQCAEWCDVTWQDKKGFAIATALDRTSTTPGKRASKPRDPYATEIPDKGEVPMSLGSYVAPDRHYGPYFWSYGPPSGPFKGTSGIGYRGRW
jgi:uncharacterized protein YraI